jgi:AcrR family transcriptional regulator
VLDQKILRVARELLAAHGYCGFSLNDVAKRAGVSKPTIYRRFSGGKVSLVIAAFRSIPTPVPVERDSSPRWAAKTAQAFGQDLEEADLVRLLAAAISARADAPRVTAAFRKAVFEPRIRNVVASLGDQQVANAMLGAAIARTLQD